MQINLDTRNIQFSPFRPIRAWNKLYKKFMAVVAQQSVLIIRKNTPVRSGDMSNSIQISYGKQLTGSSRGRANVVSTQINDEEPEEIVGNSIDRRVTVRITPTIWYAPFVNEGTRYQKAQKFVDRSIGEINEFALEQAKVIFGNWPKSWRWEPATGGDSSFFDDYYDAGGVSVFDD